MAAQLAMLKFVQMVDLKVAWMVEMNDQKLVD
jgi:capsid portal protein